MTTWKFENHQKNNFMSSSTTSQEAAMLQHHRAAHHGTVTQAALDNTPFLIHYLLPGFF